MDEKWYFDIVLICIDPIMNEVECFFMCLKTIFVNFTNFIFVNFLFIYFAHFLKLDCGLFSPQKCPCKLALIL